MEDARPSQIRRPVRGARIAILAFVIATLALVAAGPARAQETGDPILTPCHHPCPATLSFAKAYGQLDKLVFHLRIMPIGPIDPATENVTIGLQNADGTIAGETLAPGTITARESGVYHYDDPQARKAGGVARLKIRPRKDPLGGYRVDIVMYGDYSIATLPTMSTVFLVGDDLFNDIGTWTQAKNGWVYEFPS